MAAVLNNPPSTADAREFYLNGNHAPSRHQNRGLKHFLNSRLQFFLYLWYKQFTESKSVAAGRVCVNLSRPPGI
jgi:hypothetical protein